MSQLQTREEEVYSQIRANIAFEHMIVAVLIGALASASAAFLINNLFSMAKGAWNIGSLLQVGMGAITFAFLTFLIGFAASVVIGVPLFMALERIQLRKIWPYVAVAVAVEYVVLVLFFGRVPTIDTPATLLFLAPGVLIALIFGYRIRPVWRAAERAAEKPTPIVVRLH